MRLLIGLALLALACALLAAGVGAQERSLALEARSASSLTVTWSWDGQPAAFEVAWRARGDDDDETAWRTVRTDADERRHIIENLDAGVHYVVRVRGLDAADRPIDDLRGVFATSWSAPRLLRVIASDDGALTLSWSPPSDWTPQGWRLSWRVAGAQTAGGTIDLPAAARSRRIDGLTTGADYRIRLTALNSRGGESPAQTLRATAADAGLATPKLTALSWSGLTIRAEWDAVPRATGYDLYWSTAEHLGGPVGQLSVEGTSAEFAVPAAGAYWVELQARIGSGPAAVRSDRSQPRNLILRLAPHYLRVLSFDGERARLTWPGVDTPHYDLEWGEQGETKQTATRDGRSGVLEVGPLEGGKTYEFRVRARNVWGASGWSPATMLTPTAWPQRPPLAAYLPDRGLLYALWPPADGAEWYEFGWVNAADPAETARVRVPPTLTEGGSVAAELGREGGFEDGEWLLRVRAGPHGVWSEPGSLTLASLPARLVLALRMSAVPCTEATKRELSWGISGGVPSYTVAVGEEQPVDVRLRWSLVVDCGLLPTDPQPCDPEPKSHQTFRAVLTDSRGVTATAELQVAVAEPPQRPVPGAVLSGASADSAVRLGWTAVTEGSSVCAYELRYQSTSWDADSWPDAWTSIDETIGGSATEYLHSGLDPARRYRYQVRARNNLGAGEWSRPFPETAARPGAPTLTARTVASGSVALSWVPGSAGAARWEYRQRPADGGWGDWTPIAGSDASTATHAVTGLTEDARYRFQVRAVGVGGPGPASATAAAVTGLTPTVPSDREPLHYDDLDSTDGAVRPGSYAFLTDAADLTSGATTFAGVSSAEALLLNTSGYVRRDYADVLSAVEVGDRITWHPASGCWYYYQVTEILDSPPAPARKLLRIALDTADPCGSTTTQRSDPTYFDEMRDWVATFDWNDDPPNQPEIGADGIRIMPVGYAVEGGHTYRLPDTWGRPTSIVIDVPAGMRLINPGHAVISHGPAWATYVDEATGTSLRLEEGTGRHASYRVEIPEGETEPPGDVIARFETLIASIREELLP